MPVLLSVMLFVVWKVIVASLPQLMPPPVVFALLPLISVPVNVVDPPFAYTPPPEPFVATLPVIPPETFRVPAL